MQIPKALFIQTIEPRNVHLDVHSKEKHTGVIKAKYKLAGNHLPTGGTLFWIYTSQDETYPQDKNDYAFIPQ
ncbi:MAG: hypothetical protein WDN66_05805 [Candidatus Saccharibacteria bacterium]